MNYFFAFLVLFVSSALSQPFAPFAAPFSAPSVAPPPSGGCSSCSPAYPVCLYCPSTAGNGMATAGCFPEGYRYYTCCGCVNGACTACPSQSSCATWSPYNPTFCPASNQNDNSTFFPSALYNVKVTLPYQGRAVYRTHSVPTFQTVTIGWNVRPNSDGEFTVFILDRSNFDAMMLGYPFNCLNPNCFLAGSVPKYGQLNAYGSSEYFLVVTKTNDNWSGTSSYWVNGFVQRA